MASFDKAQHHAPTALVNKCSKHLIVLSVLAASLVAGSGAAAAAESPPGANPVLRARFTADPAPLVVGDTVYLYVGRDEAKGNDFFLMKQWLCYSSEDLRHWHGAGQGLAIAYRPQGAGLLSVDFSGHPSVVLRAGRRYALALQGDKGALTVFLRASRGDVYADGEASVDDRPLKDPQGRPADFAFALYARYAASPCAMPPTQHFIHRHLPT